MFLPGGLQQGEMATIQPGRIADEGVVNSSMNTAAAYRQPRVSGLPMPDMR